MALPSASRATAVRLFVTVFVVYALHLATNVVRETYLAITLGERLSIRVDEYLGLHPDLFEIEGRGGFINNNPGASMLGAVPYALARPLIGLALRSNPELTHPKPAATYADPRPNRTTFLNEARARGLDIKLALAAASMQLGLVAPLGALAAVLLFLHLRARLGDDRCALWLSLLYAFGTPIFFRSAFLNQNLLIAHFTLFAFLLLMHGAEGTRAAVLRRWPLLGTGLLLGLSLLCDYSAIPIVMAFGIWMTVAAARAAGWPSGARAAGLVAAGAAGPLLLLFGYQWTAFGSPLFPAQRYMPDTPLSVRGWNGITIPDPALLFENLLSPGFGLLIFCPMLALAFAAPFIRRRSGLTTGELTLIFGTFAALYLFNSANQFARLQFNTGIRYMVPAVPLLFVALVPVLLRLPRLLFWAAVLPTVVISWAVSMTRENVPTALLRVFVGGFELPFLTVLQKTAEAYAPFLQGRSASPLPLFALTGVFLWLVWRGGMPARAGKARATPVAGSALD